jgi:hypothetical protein
MDLTEKDYRLKQIQTLVTTIGMIVALLAGALGYLDYSRKAKLQALRGLHDAQLQTCNRVSDAAARLFSATDHSKFDAAFTSFTELKHGMALTILDEPVLNRMIRVYNLALSAKNNIGSNVKGEAFRAAVRRTLCAEPFIVVTECRRLLVDGFQKEANGGISIIDPEYVMKWADCDGPSPSNDEKKAEYSR